MTRSRKGFTLIELLIIISIFLLIAGIGIAPFKAYQSDLELRASARDIASYLRFAQQSAVSEQIEYAVQFILAEKKYEIIKCKEPEEIVKENALPERIQFSEINGFSNNRAEFNPYGAARRSGNIVLINDRSEILTIEVKPSGHIKIIE